MLGAGEPVQRHNPATPTDFGRFLRAVSALVIVVASGTLGLMHI